MRYHITLAVTGSISAYKTADLVSQLVREGDYTVNVLMTEAATHFITPLTFQVLSKNVVHLDIMAESDPQFVNHIQLSKITDLFIVAPASANTIAKLTNGFADNMVTSTALALDMKTRKLIVPAMNTKMYENPVTQKNLQILQNRGYEVVQPRKSLLACGDVGIGAIADLSSIIKKIRAITHGKKEY